MGEKGSRRASCLSTTKAWPTTYMLNEREKKIYKMSNGCHTTHSHHNIVVACRQRFCSLTNETLCHNQKEQKKMNNANKIMSKYFTGNKPDYLNGMMMCVAVPYMCLCGIYACVCERQRLLLLLLLLLWFCDHGAQQANHLIRLWLSN